jgi:hypothetical protein
MSTQYRCVATSVEGFVQQLAACYLRHGYWWYVCGMIPVWKNCDLVDEKLLSKYAIAISESTRARRKRAGQANLQYLRYERFFVLLATQGKHAFFEQEAGSIRDIRRVPIKFHGYSISYRPGGRTRTGEKDPRWHSHVEIERGHYKELKALLLELATHRSASRLALEFYRLPYEPYAPIRRQMLNLLRAVNRARKLAGCELLPNQVLPLRRRVVKPFQPLKGSEPKLREPDGEENARSAGGLLVSKGITADDGVSVRALFPDPPLRCHTQIRSPHSDA